MLINDNKKIVSIDDNIFNAKYLSDITFCENDYILNSLLTLLPEKLFIHIIDKPIDDFINTLQMIFSNKVIICKDCPICRTYNIDKMIAVAEYHGIEPVIILNKSDYEDVTGVSQVYGKLPYRVYSVTALDKDGTDVVANEIKGFTCVLAGVSGVGKSTLLNAIAPELLRATGDVSERLRRGKHTTRCAELFDVCGGTIADTPGFSSLELEAFDLKDRSKLADCFAEFRPYFDECRFHDCAHVKDLGCSVREACEEGKIQKSRYESYVQMYNELGEYKKWEDK